MRGRILFASVHPPGRAPSQRFRFEQYVDFLRDNGLETTFAPVLRPGDYAVVYAPGSLAAKAAIAARTTVRRAADVLRVRNYDIVFVQREAMQLGTAFFERVAARSRAKLVFDFDDAIWLPNVSEANERLAWLKRPQKTHDIIAAADLVFAGNDYLADYARRYNEQVKVIPTTIDTERFRPRPRRDTSTVCIGWTGSMTTIQHLELALPVLRRVRERYGDRVRFKVIGDTSFRVDDLGIRGQEWSADSEVEDLSDIDIGIMPLPDDEWARGKCGLKGLQYMALEIPSVLSPVGVNETIIDHGRNGFLSSSEEEWVARLSELIDSAELRARLGAAGRATVVQCYSVKSQENRYLDLLAELL